MDAFLERLPSLPGDFWAVLVQMAPYLLLGFLAAGLLSVLIPPSAIDRHLGGRGPWPVLKAALLGVPLPLCSCSVLPVSASLRKHGASRGATTSFLVSTPQTGVDSIMVTWSLMGGVFAVFRPIAAFVSGIAAGLAVAATERRSTVGETGPGAPAACQDACCTEPHGSKVRKAARYAFVTLPAEIGPPLLVGVTVAAAVAVLLPPGLLASWLGGGGGLLAILVMMLAGIPIYVCATASVPVAAALILTQGISPGAAFAFLVTGPATNAAAIATIWRVLGARATGIYVAVIVASAIGGGLLLDQITTAAVVAHMHEHGSELIPPVLAQVSAVALLAMLAWSTIQWMRSRLHARKRLAPARQTIELSVSGMTCSHCAATIEKAVRRCAGVADVRVDVGGGRVGVAGAAMDAECIKAAITDAGYQVQP
jgi:uncharacterized membrane protein YraQ (UPF0718 family)/copper chaperone CopZ